MSSILKGSISLTLYIHGTVTKTFEMKKIKIAIIGIGHLGSIHLKDHHALSDKVEIVGICDIKTERAQKLAKQHNIPFVESYKEFLGKIDAVDICVPTEHHYEIANFFLSNNVHTFIEKPISSTLEQAEDLIQTADTNGLKLQIGHIERFNSAFESIKHFAKKPLFIECHRLNNFPNRSLDIGVVMDLMIHDIDIILGLIKSPIKDIQATGVKVLTLFEDIASVRITFANGCVCNLTASRVSEDVMRKIRIFQNDTYISLDYVKQEAFIYKRHEKQILKHSLPIDKQQPLRKELEHFIDCIIEDKTPLVSGKEGKEALDVALQVSKIIWDTQKKFNSV